MEEHGISEQMLPPHSVRGRISHAKNAMIPPQRFAQMATDFAGERIAKVYASYEKRLAACGALDFDDLIVRPVRLLAEQPGVLAEERRRIRHLLIDEYQDTNSAQDALVKRLGEGADSLAAVGDEDQAIYRWRGAEVEHILRFEEDFPGAKVIALERNYRSTDKILAAASGARLAQPQAAREAAPLRPRRRRGGAASGASTRTAPRSRPSRARSRPRPSRRARRRSSTASTPSRGRSRRSSSAPEDPVRRRRRHEVLRARGGQGRARVPAARRAPRGRPRVPPRRERPGPRHRRARRSTGSPRCPARAGSPGGRSRPTPPA